MYFVYYSIVRLAWFLRCSRVAPFKKLSEHVCDTAIIVSEHTLRLTFEPFLFYVWGVSAMGAIWLNNIRPGDVHMFCMQPLLQKCSCLIVLCFVIFMNLRLFLALIVIVFLWYDQLRLLLKVTPIYFVFSVVLRVVSYESLWEDKHIWVNIWLGDTLCPWFTRTRVLMILV